MRTKNPSGFLSNLETEISDKKRKTQSQANTQLNSSDDQISHITSRLITQVPKLIEYVSPDHWLYIRGKKNALPYQPKFTIYCYRTDYKVLTRSLKGINLNIGISFKIKRKTLILVSSFAIKPVALESNFIYVYSVGLSNKLLKEIREVLLFWFGVGTPKLTPLNATKNTISS